MHVTDAFALARSAEGGHQPCGWNTKKKPRASHRMAERLLPPRKHTATDAHVRRLLERLRRWRNCSSPSASGSDCSRLWLRSSSRRYFRLLMLSCPCVSSPTRAIRDYGNMEQCFFSSTGGANNAHGDGDKFVVARIQLLEVQRGHFLRNLALPPGKLPWTVLSPSRAAR